MLADVYSSMAGVIECEGEGVRACHIILLLSVNLAQFVHFEQNLAYCKPRIPLYHLSICSLSQIDQ